ncbi:N-acetylglucosaminidase [Staphylococcus arlettae]|uniref:N-acetylglucosaminidase n=1 Tax=Staphylococcus arlettae TaxID=29378 RepID=UPI0028A4C0CB|nr:N-acetylglucosaminidase [Staphylococcus arlettae]MDT4051811.1 N-acetylglucosaminidase [Staphylococcus arlettae]
MNEIVKQRLPMIFLTIILVIFAILLIINETELFENKQKYTFDEAVNRQLAEGTLNMKEENQQFVDASRAEVAEAMKIENSNDDLNHMDISEPVYLSEKEVNQILRDKGVFKDKGKAFLEAQEKHDVNVIYLISHALVETGNGKSNLAKGIKDKGKHYYNFFGIGAFDEAAVQTGSSFAKQQKWDSPEKAIEGGAKFVRGNYFDKDQISLYQMRWNPENPGKHQYASDIEWDENIARIMKRYYDKLGIKKDDISKHYYK